MSTKAELKWVRSLHQKKYREEEGLYLVQGIKLVTELLQSDQRIRSLHATQEVADRLRDERVMVWPAHDLERMGTLEHGNEVVAVVQQPEPKHFTALQEGELALALDGITDPGNMGTLLRIADWFGVERVLCSVDSVEEFNPKCVQASMGSILRVEVHRAQLPRMLDGLRASGAALYLATMEGKSVFETKLSRPSVLILGSEAHGPSEQVRSLNAISISVPRAGQAESLNVASAASALCMEFARQRGVA